MSDNNAPNERQKRVEEEPLSDNKAPHMKYDVFVSFRGEIRRGFLSHLIDAFERSQITAFVDDKLERGEEIGPSLVGAIKGSSISLIIFSQGYASSRWCLEELVTILECKEEYRQIVIPVFYGVDPTDVRHQSSESYKKAFAEHEKKYETKVPIWRDALNRSAEISGIASSKFPNDAGLVKEIVNLVLTKLDALLLNSKGLVGINEKIADVESLICKRKEPKDICLIGIWGMAGIGKTTLAEEIYNKLQSEYEACYFLLNEREQSRTRGILSLKNEIFSKLLQDVVEIHTLNSLPNNVVRRIGRMRVLIVLDDVNDSNHLQNLLGTLDNFGSGSRIIVTTRNEQVLNANKADEIYRLREFSSDKALELFNLIAFNKSDHQREFDDLSKKMVHYAKGIPLVLKVLANHLCTKKKKVWESWLAKLKQMPFKEVFDVMKLSYDDLDDQEKQIFLDLACFFLRLHGKINVGHLNSLLKDDESDDSVVASLESLKDKALITFSEDNFICMHDSLQEMGQKIVCQESSKDPGSCSWLRDPNGFCKALTYDEGTDVIRSIEIDLTKIKEQKLSSFILTKMRRLKFLEVYSSSYHHNIVAEEGLQFLTSGLRFLCWYSYSLKSLPENFSVEKLVILRLPFCKMEKLWDGVKNLVNLKELDLRHSEELKVLPDLSKATNLEVLDLRCCSKLIMVHPSIFSLAKLEKVDIGNCKSFAILASYLAYTQLRGIKYLNHDDCKNLGEFSLILENMKKEKVPSCKFNSLHVTQSDLEELPSCYNNLVQLLHLQVSCCNKLQTIPELPPESCCSPHTILMFPPSLEYLTVSSCESLQKLPELPPSLETLNVKSCKSLQKLPKLPPSLETLNVQCCTSLQTLPELPPFLKTLTAAECESLQNLLELPLFLKTLEVRSNKSLKSLPDFPPFFETLYVSSCDSLKSLPDFPPFLKSLEVQYCRSLHTIPKFPSSLKTLNVISCESLQNLPGHSPFLCKSLQSFPPFLETLDVKYCRSLHIIQEFPLSLKTLNVVFCESLQTLPDLSLSLEALNVTWCISLQTLPELPLSLEALNVNCCMSLQTLPELPLSLEALNVNCCISLQTLPELPLSLEALNVSCCISLQTLPELPLSLEAVDATGCIFLKTLPELPLSLEAVDATYCRSLKTVLFPSTAVEQLKESRKRVMFWNCLNLDEHSLVAIGLNAQINVMKFANQHLSAPNHDHVENYNDYEYEHRSYQAVYMYPGSNVAEWLEYKTTKDYIIIDLSSAPPSPKLGFIFCFVLGECQEDGIGKLEVNLIISDDDGEGKKDGVNMYIEALVHRIESDHVCVMYDQRCSDFLNRIAKKQTRFKIHVSMEVKYCRIPLVLKGFGVSPMSTSAYSSFIQQMELRDSMLQFH